MLTWQNLISLVETENPKIVLVVYYTKLGPLKVEEHLKKQLGTDNVRNFWSAYSKIGVAETILNESKIYIQWIANSKLEKIELIKEVEEFDIDQFESDIVATVFNSPVLRLMRGEF